MKIDRLLGILTVLLQKESVTAPYLAEKFEVSRRTVSRDIDVLCKAGIPIYTKQGGGGGICIADGFKLDKNVLTKDELTNMITSLKALGSVSEKSSIEKTIEKLTGNGETVISLRDSIIIDLSSHSKNVITEKIKLIKSAISESRLISFTYYYEKGETARKIEPYFITFQWNAWYIFGYCVLREDWRLFKLSRLWNLTVCEEQFSLRDIPPGRENLFSYFTDEYKLTAVFEASEKYRLIDEYGIDCSMELSDGKLLLELNYTNKSYILNWLLSFGSKVYVTEPALLAEEIKKTAFELLEIYKD